MLTFKNKNRILNRLYLIVVVQGFLSGLPYVAVTSTLQVRFISEGASILLIGSLSLISQIYLYKPILAPIFDSYHLSFLTKYVSKQQGWIFIIQINLALSLILMALISGRMHPYILIIIAFITALLSACQDVNIDSLRVQILRKENLVNGSSYYLIAFRFATLLAGGIAVYLKPYISWKSVYLTFSLIIAFGSCACFVPVDLKKDNDVKFNNPFKLIFNSYKDLKNRPYIIYIFLFILFYGLGDALTLSVNSVFLLRNLKMGIQNYALYANFMNMLMLFISTYIAQICFKRFNPYKCALTFGLLQTLTISLYLILTYSGYIKFIAIPAILLEGLTGGMIASTALFIISTVAKSPYIATQYALFSAVSAITSIFLGPIAALIVKEFSWHILYFLAVVCSLPGLILIIRLKYYFINSFTKIENPAMSFNVN